MRNKMVEFCWKRSKKTTIFAEKTWKLTLSETRVTSVLRFLYEITNRNFGE